MRGWNVGGYALLCLGGIHSTSEVRFHPRGPVVVEDGIQPAVNALAKGKITLHIQGSPPGPL